MCYIDKINYGGEFFYKQKLFTLFLWVIYSSLYQKVKNITSCIKLVDYNVDSNDGENIYVEFLFWVCFYFMFLCSFCFNIMFVVLLGSSYLVFIYI